MSILNHNASDSSEGLFGTRSAMNQVLFNPPIIAHRGASAYAPENTIAAFTKAIQLGAKWIEFDVQLSSLNEVIVFHDTILDRVTNGHGTLKKYPFAYLESLDAGKWFHANFSGERILSLKQALTFLADKHISVNIELKPEKDHETALVDAVLEITNATKTPAIQIIYSSFCLKTLYYLRQTNHTANIGLLMHEVNSRWENIAEELNALSINCSEAMVNSDLIEKAKKINTLITCYTVNNPKTALNLYSLGVDALFTDVPDIILAAIKHTSMI